MSSDTGEVKLCVGCFKHGPTESLEFCTPCRCGLADFCAQRSEAAPSDYGGSPARRARAEAAWAASPASRPRTAEATPRNDSTVTELVVRVEDLAWDGPGSGPFKLFVGEWGVAEWPCRHDPREYAEATATAIRKALADAPRRESAQPWSNKTEAALRAAESLPAYCPHGIGDYSCVSQVACGQRIRDAERGRAFIGEPGPRQAVAGPNAGEADPFDGDKDSDLTRPVDYRKHLVRLVDFVRADQCTEPCWCCYDYVRQADHIAAQAGLPANPKPGVEPPSETPSSGVK